jgi:hypothetical protein
LLYRQLTLRFLILIPILFTPVAFAAFDPALMREDGIFGSFPAYAGAAGIHAADVDGDGTPEIAVGHYYSWYVLGWEQETGNYIQRHYHDSIPGKDFSSLFDYRIFLDAGDVDDDGKYEVVVMNTDGGVCIHDAITGALESSFDTGSIDPADLKVSDVDPSSPGDEIILLDSIGVHVYGAGSATSLWDVFGAGGYDLAVGNIDGDPAREILVATGAGSPGLLVDSGMRAVDWVYPPGFGYLVAAGDIDGDGMDEIVAKPGDLVAIDGDSRSQKWAVSSDARVLKVKDTDQDGIGEVMAGYRDVCILDGETGTETTRFQNRFGEITDCDAGDVDGDCKIEALWGGGEDEQLFVADMGTRAIEWNDSQVSGPFYSLGIADIDADGTTEILRISSWSAGGWEGPVLFVSNLQQARDEYFSGVPITDSNIRTLGMTIAQLDADPQLEYVINDVDGTDIAVSAFDGITHTLQWTTPYWFGGKVALASGDLNGDSAPEILLGGWRNSGPVSVRRSSDGAELWGGAGGIFLSDRERPPNRGY